MDASIYSQNHFGHSLIHPVKVALLIFKQECPSGLRPTPHPCLAVTAQSWVSSARSASPGLLS